MNNRIRQLRQELRMTQTRLSIELEVSQETVSAYESGKYYPGFQTLVQLSKILNSSIDYMMGLSEVRHPTAASPDRETEALLALWSRLDPVQKQKVLAYIQGQLDR